MKSEPIYPCKRMRCFRATFGDLAACFPCQSWADYTINMFEIEFPTETGRRAPSGCKFICCGRALKKKSRRASQPCWSCEPEG
jgi:hypothetical protein